MLQVRRVAILGLGNVALDCARVLLQHPSRLKSTDIASHALHQLSESGVQQVDLIGRRGPAQVGAPIILHVIPLIFSTDDKDHPHQLLSTKTHHKYRF